MIRVLLNASSPMAKAGLESLLRAHRGVQLMDGPPGGVSGPRAAVESPPDVLVVEAETLADASSREAIDWASAGGPVVMLVRNPAGEPVAEALRAGVKAVLPSGLPGPEIAAAIEAAAAGLVVLDGNNIDSLLRPAGAVSSRDREALVEDLSPREIEVLGLLAAGLGNKEIASRLKISEHTVKFHVASVMGKLGAASRTEAVTLGIRLGLIMI